MQKAKIIFFLILAMLLSYAFAKNYGSALCKNLSDYTCHTTKRGETWQRLFPNEEQRDLVMRLNRRNEQLHSGLVIAIPRSTDTNFMDYSPMPHTIPPSGSKIIYVSLTDQAFGAYDENGILEYWGPVSSALGYCPDIGRGCHTPTGHFAIQYKEGPGCVSTKFPVGKGGAPMPWCMYFHGGFALHGSYELPGYNASHGCVRMFVNDAKWLNQEFTADEAHVPVIIESSSQMIGSSMRAPKTQLPREHDYNSQQYAPHD